MEDAKVQSELSAELALDSTQEGWKISKQEIVSLRRELGQSRGKRRIPPVKDDQEVARKLNHVMLIHQQKTLVLLKERDQSLANLYSRKQDSIYKEEVLLDEIDIERRALAKLIKRRIAKDKANDKAQDSRDAWKEREVSIKMVMCFFVLLVLFAIDLVFFVRNAEGRRPQNFLQAWTTTATARMPIWTPCLRHPRLLRLLLRRQGALPRPIQR